jgi:hypothetical protein
MRRREFLGVVGGAAVAWSVVARAQQPRSLPICRWFRQASLNLVIYVRTAKKLGLTIPEQFLLRADEVIE